MFLLINRSAECGVQGAEWPAIVPCTRHIARLLLLLATAIFSSCSEKQPVTQHSFYNIDSLVDRQVQTLKSSKYELNKVVEIGGKQEQTHLTPDSTQWATELEVFRQLAQVNKAAFRDAYVVSDMRDTNSNLTVREIRAQRPVPVSLVRLYYLRTPADLRKVEATFVEENEVYTNTRQMVLELERFSNGNLLRRYRVKSLQKFMMDDTVRFVIAGSVEL